MKRDIFEIAIKEVTLRLYKNGVLKSPITQQGQLDMIARIEKIEADIINEYYIPEDEDK